jgi:cytochrome bd-type quinol oxidase subunit 2
VAVGGSGRPHRPAGSWPRRGIWAALAAAVVAVSWALMIGAAWRTLSFEPNSDAAKAAAAEGRTGALAWALVEMAAAAVLAYFARRPWLAILAAPGLAVAGVVVLDPQSNGGALTLGLLVSLVSVAVAVVIAAVERGRRAR